MTRLHVPFHLIRIILFLIILCLWGFDMVYGQSANDARKELHFDVEDSATFNVPSNAFAVMYKRLYKHRTLKEQIDAERSKNKRLIKKYPFAIQLKHQWEAENDTAKKKTTKKELKKRAKDAQSRLDSLKSHLLSLTAALESRSKTVETAAWNNYTLKAKEWDSLFSIYHKLADSFHYRGGPGAQFTVLPTYLFEPSADGKGVTVRFSEDKLFDADTAKVRGWYFNPNRLKKVKLDKNQALKKYHTLEPNARYAIIFLYRIGDSLLALFEDYHATLSRANLPKPDIDRYAVPRGGYNINLPLPEPADQYTAQWDSLTKPLKSRIYAISSQQEKSANLSFFEDKWRYFNSSYTQYHDLISRMKRIKDSLQISNRVISDTLFNWLDKASLIFTQKELLKEQSLNLESTGITRDSLARLFRLVESLYALDTATIQSLNAGTLTIGTMTAVENSSAINHLNQSQKSLEQLIQYTYHLMIPAYRQNSTASALLGRQRRFLTYWHKELTNRIDSLDKQAGIKKFIIDSINKSVFYSGVVQRNGGTFVNEFVTRGKLSIMPDFGVVYYGFGPESNKAFRSISPYIGIQFNFRPYNKKAQFKYIPGLTCLSRHRWSASLGLTLVSLKEEGKRENLFANGGLMMGFGYRLGGAVRVTGGSIFFKKYKENLLSSQKQLAATPYLGLSIDFDLRDLFNNIFGTFLK